VLDLPCQALTATFLNCAVPHQQEGPLPCDPPLPLGYFFASPFLGYLSFFFFDWVTFFHPACLPSQASLGGALYFSPFARHSFSSGGQAPHLLFFVVERMLVSFNPPPFLHQRLRGQAPITPSAGSDSPRPPKRTLTLHASSIHEPPPPPLRLLPLLQRVSNGFERFRSKVLGNLVCQLSSGSKALACPPHGDPICFLRAWPLLSHFTPLASLLFSSRRESGALDPAPLSPRSSFRPCGLPSFWPRTPFPPPRV